MIDINKEISENEKLIINFHAVSWCQPCKMMEPVLENIENTTDIKVVKVDVEKENELATLFGVNSIPTMFLYKDGERLTEKVGVQQKGLIIDLFA